MIGPPAAPPLPLVDVLVLLVDALVLLEDPPVPLAPVHIMPQEPELEPPAVEEEPDPTS